MILPPPATDKRIAALVDAVGDVTAIRAALAALDVIYTTSGMDGRVAAPVRTVELVGGDGIVGTLVAAGLVVEADGGLRVPDEDVDRFTAFLSSPEVQEKCARIANRNRMRVYRQSKPKPAPREKVTPPAKGDRRFIEYGPLPITLCGRTVTLHKGEHDGSVFAQVEVDGGKRLQANVDKVRPGDHRGVAEAIVSAAYRFTKKNGPVAPSPDALKIAAKRIPAANKASLTVENWAIYGEAIREGRDPLSDDVAHVAHSALQCATGPDDAPDAVEGELFPEPENKAFSHDDAAAETCSAQALQPPLKKELKKESSLSSGEGVAHGIRHDPAEPIRPPRAASITNPEELKAAIRAEIVRADIPEQHRSAAATAVLLTIDRRKLSLFDMTKAAERAFDAAVADGLLEVESVPVGDENSGNSKKTGYALTPQLMAIAEFLRAKIDTGDPDPVPLG